jgi:hypothetical protein
MELGPICSKGVGLQTITRCRESATEKQILIGRKPPRSVKSILGRQSRVSRFSAIRTLARNGLVGNSPCLVQVFINESAVAPEVVIR